MNTTELGRRAEDFAAELLEARFGWVLLEKNWRTRSCEIDLIMLEGGKTVHFVEVKFRRGNFAGGGLDAINTLKLKRMVGGALEWLEASQSDLQLNLVAVEVGLGADGKLQLGRIVESIDTSELGME